VGVTGAVLGASGYAGGELLRYLARHPAIDVVAASAATRTGAAVDEVVPHIGGGGLELVDLDDALAARAEIVFSCVPSEALPDLGPDVFLVDLSDGRRGDPAWVYGLTELARGHVAASRRIANPGCYPTATLLALVPFARRGLIKHTVVVDALSGTSGAGRQPRDHLLHASVDSSATAYGTVTHRHVPEMERGLASFGDLDATVSFTPHLVPMSRGLLVTARAGLTAPLDDDGAHEVLLDAYSDEPFISVTRGWPSTKSVAGTNRAVVSARVDARAGLIVCSAAVDNLGKGAAGQAVQNANLMLGLSETAGLDTIAVWP